MQCESIGTIFPDQKQSFTEHSYPEHFLPSAEQTNPYFPFSLSRHSTRKCIPQTHLFPVLKALGNPSGLLYPHTARRFNGNINTDNADTLLSKSIHPVSQVMNISKNCVLNQTRSQMLVYPDTMACASLK
ncbi:hypothetical protein CEXT_231101 [Caerostris extrusa]|uniref:Uncharacterized protein n=1 Tax=Caerostris extrusa TaxID=172846 RepID=A0AAV4R0B4_CAEEX|nr:hypothetical protein CEXT_231101 [Caerostris extrusa]